MREARAWRSVHAVLGVVVIVGLMVVPVTRAQGVDHPLPVSRVTVVDTADEFWFPRTRVLNISTAVTWPWHPCAPDEACEF